MSSPLPKEIADASILNIHGNTHAKIISTNLVKKILNSGTINKIKCIIFSVVVLKSSGLEIKSGNP